LTDETGGRLRGREAFKEYLRLCPTRNGRRVIRTRISEHLRSNASSEGTSVLLWSSIAGILLGLVVFGLEAGYGGMPVLDFECGYFIAAGVVGALSIVGLMVMKIIDGKRKMPVYLYYVYFIIFAVVLFCIVSASGGLTASPFVSLYGALVVTAAVITKRGPSTTLVWIVLTIAACLNSLPSFAVDMGSLARTKGIDPLQFGSEYAWKYFWVFAYSFFIMLVADWPRKPE